MSPTRRVSAPTIEPGHTVTGPASYFPSIETTYGRPIQDWLDIAAAAWQKGTSHMGVVQVLKDEHGLGHGHANSIVAYVKAELTAP